MMVESPSSRISIGWRIRNSRNGKDSLTSFRVRWIRWKEVCRPPSRMISGLFNWRMIRLIVSWSGWKEPVRRPLRPNREDRGKSMRSITSGNRTRGKKWQKNRMIVLFFDILRLPVTIKALLIPSRPNPDIFITASKKPNKQNVNGLGTKKFLPDPWHWPSRQPGLNQESLQTTCDPLPSGQQFRRGR